MNLQAYPGFNLSEIYPVYTREKVNTPPPSPHGISIFSHRLIYNSMQTNRIYITTTH